MHVEERRTPIILLSQKVEGNQTGSGGGTWPAPCSDYGSTWTWPSVAWSESWHFRCSWLAEDYLTPDAENSEPPSTLRASAYSSWCHALNCSHCVGCEVWYKVHCWQCTRFVCVSHQEPSYYLPSATHTHTDSHTSSPVTTHHYCCHVSTSTEGSASPDSHWHTPGGPDT